MDADTQDFTQAWVHCILISELCFVEHLHGVIEQYALNPNPVPALTTADGMMVDFFEFELQLFKIMPAAFTIFLREQGLPGSLLSRAMRPRQPVVPGEYHVIEFVYLGGRPTVSGHSKSCPMQLSLRCAPADNFLSPDRGVGKTVVDDGPYDL